jgi:outer membrane lipoprotein LolB
MSCRWLAITGLALLLGANLPVGTDGLGLARRQAALEAVPTWEMRGRLAINTGQRAFQGSFSWRQQADVLDLAVRGPLGAGVLHVAGSPSELTFTARGETRKLTDPEAELQALLGWWLPVTSLHSWLLGLPDSGFRAATEAGADGTLAELQQRLWRVTYPAYQIAPLAGTPMGILVPRRIDMQHGDLLLRLTVDDWNPAHAP